MRIPKVKAVAFLSFCVLTVLSYSLLVGYFDDWTQFGLNEEDDNSHQIKSRVYGSSTNRNDSCILPTLNPWDPSIRKQMQEPESKSRSCSTTFEKMTSLKAGILRDHFTSNFFLPFLTPKCFYRCLHAVNDYKMKVDDWTVISAEGAIPGCDVVEVGCWRFSIRVYSFIHTQIVEKPAPKLDTQSKYSLYWIVIDTISMSMFERALPKTMRVGLNSRPNAYAMFFVDKDAWCGIPLDNKNYISFDFKRAGYVTHSSEDWALGVMNWANCTGFERKQADHVIKPFWLRLQTGFMADGHYAVRRSYYDAKLYLSMFDRSCTQQHHYIFEQLLQFASAYKDQPKFSITWTVQLAHDSNIELFYEDEFFANFFEKLHEQTKNAFIFFQSDHGARFGPVRKIPIIGMLEDNNPFLYVSVPEHLRKNKNLMTQMKENSQQLLSQFDLYASALQIAKVSHEWNETTEFNQPMSSASNQTLHGSSLFHKMNQPRDCDSLSIPQEYCICLQESRQLNDKELALKVVQALIDSMNTKLEKSEYNDLCHKHTPSDKSPILLEELKQKDPNTRMLSAKFKTMPGNALYQGIVMATSFKSINFTGEFKLSAYRLILKASTVHSRTVSS
ncbi:hypothetical protein M3Y97_00943400 [Aphelenchoides bicaudatus]|nr:hypothetical protein M3Y97_00943400 [Aphelenchoides bicaudatus]